MALDTRVGRFLAAVTLIASQVACDKSYVAPETGAASETSDPEGRPPRPRDTEPTESATILDAACELRASNALLIDCVVETDTSATVELRFDDGSGPRVSRQSVGTLHELTLFVLNPNRTYDIEAVATAGGAEDSVGGIRVTTGQAPMESSTGAVATARGAYNAGFVLTNLSCSDTDYVAVFNADGEVAWYQETGGYGRTTSAITLTDSGTVLAVVDDQWLIEWDLDGTLLREWNESFLGAYIHHDVHVRDGLLWAASIEPFVGSNGRNYAIDAIRAWDASGNRVVDWDLTEILDPTVYGWNDVQGYWSEELPGHFDPFHLNSFQFDDNGDWILSFKDMGQVLKVHGDPGASDFGALDWLLDAENRGSMSLSSGGVPAGFLGQHHVTKAGTTMWMFDNLGESAARALRLEVDETSNVATAVEQRSMAMSCPMVGSVFPIGDHVLALCGTENHMKEFDASGSVVWELSHACGGGVPSYRAVPVNGVAGI